MYNKDQGAYVRQQAVTSSCSIRLPTVGRRLNQGCGAGARAIFDGWGQSQKIGFRLHSRGLNWHPTYRIYSKWCVCVFAWVTNLKRIMILWRER